MIDSRGQWSLSKGSQSRNGHARRRRTCVFFHAHPDDEALLTGGTMARLAAEGHRVVLVLATAGERGTAAGRLLGSRPLSAVRTAEVHMSAGALGCARVEFLGYRDSGMPGEAPVTDAPLPFSRVPVEEAASRLADLLREEHADLLTGYDPAGGYGHPDHIQVHRVATRAAELAGTPVLLQATMDRDRLMRLMRLAAPIRGLVPTLDPRTFTDAYTPGRAITHRIDVRRYTAAKRASLAAHVSQATGGDSVRTFAALLALPAPAFRWLVGTEWYVRTPTTGR
jgi:LmbE family N-acetylglucosaminyl deacetylase